MLRSIIGSSNCMASPQYSRRSLRPMALLLSVLFMLLLPFQDGLAADCGSEWTWSNPLPQGNDLHDVAWGGGMFVAVGDGGTILASPDGVRWTPQNSGTAEVLSKVLWNGDVYLVTGSSGILLTSPDGSRWTRQYTGINGATFRDVIWGNGQFVMILDQYDSRYSWISSIILTSPDGSVWTQRDVGLKDAYLYALAWGGGQFVIFGGQHAPYFGEDYYNAGGFIISSPDGATWTQRMRVTRADFGDVAWGGGQFVAGGNNMALTSPDGIQWTQHTLSSEEGTVLASIVSNGSYYIASTFSSVDLLRYLLIGSRNGIDWTVISDSRSEGPFSFSIWFAGNLFFAQHGGRGLMSSPDGLSWTSLDETVGFAIAAIAWSGSRFVAVGQEGMIHSSTDGTNWIRESWGIVNLSLRAVVRRGGRFIVTAIGPRVVGGEVFTSPILMTSRDGKKWTLERLDVPTRFDAWQEIYDIAWNGSRFVAVGDWVPRAIALCRRAPENQLSPVVVVKGSPEFTAAEAIF